MYHLRESDNVDNQKVWKAFENGDFSWQKTNIPGTAIGRDHCGKQENKKIKNRGGITGITMNENSRTRYVLASLKDQMFNLGGHIGKRSAGKHHQLSNTYIKAK